MDKLKKRSADIVLVAIILMLAYASSIFGNVINEKVQYHSIYYLHGMIFSSLPGLLLIFATLSESIATSNDFLIKKNQGVRQVGGGSVLLNIVLFFIFIFVFSTSFKSYFFYSILLQLGFIIVFVKNEYIDLEREMQEKNEDHNRLSKYSVELLTENSRLLKKTKNYAKLSLENQKLEKKIKKYEK